MSMSDTSFSAFVPGFDFLQGLVKNAGAAIPGFNQWVAPTLNPQELEKRINELRTVQFWLEQNARMLATTIQALEVQRMTLSTLNAMNVPMADLKQVLKTPPMPEFRPPVWPGSTPKADAAPAAKPSAKTPKPDLPSEDDDEPAAASAADNASTGSGAGNSAKGDRADEAKAGPTGVDPMQWWNALTQQFTQIATQAMKDNSLVKQGMDAASETFRKAAAMPGEMMSQAAKAAQAATTAPGKATKAATGTAPADAAATPRPASAAKSTAKPRATAAKPAAKRSAAKPATKTSARKPSGTARRAP